jgi:hypothetical protein
MKNTPVARIVAGQFHNLKNRFRIAGLIAHLLWYLDHDLVLSPQ